MEDKEKYLKNIVKEVNPYYIGDPEMDALDDFRKTETGKASEARMNKILRDSGIKGSIIVAGTGSYNNEAKTMWIQSEEWAKDTIPVHSSKKQIQFIEKLKQITEEKQSVTTYPRTPTSSR